MPTTTTETRGSVAVLTISDPPVNSLGLAAARVHGRTDDLATGKRFAARWFFAHELPKAQAWPGAVRARDATCLKVPAASF